MVIPHVFTLTAHISSKSLKLCSLKTPAPAFKTLLPVFFASERLNPSASSSDTVNLSRLSPNVSNGASLYVPSPFFITLLFSGLEKAFDILSPAFFNMLPKSSLPDETVRSIEWSGCGASCSDITSPLNVTPIFLSASSIITSNRLCILSVSFLKKSSSEMLLSSRSSSLSLHWNFLSSIFLNSIYPLFKTIIYQYTIITYFC